MSPDDNPPYVTIKEILGKCYVVKMEYDARADAYQVSHSRPCDYPHAAMVRDKWAADEGLEVR